MKIYKPGNFGKEYNSVVVVIVRSPRWTDWVALLSLLATTIMIVIQYQS